MKDSILLPFLILSFLAVFTFFDLKLRKLPVPFLMLFFLTGIVYVVIIGDYKNLSRYLGILIGLCFLSFSILSKESLGKGDSLLFIILGWFLGIYSTLFLLFVAFGLSALVSIGLLVCKSGNLKTTFPFLPFLFLAYGGMCLL